VAENIPVEDVVTERTYVGKVRFPVAVPERLVDLFRFPDDVFEHAEELGLDKDAVKFLMAVLHGRWGLSVELDLVDVAIGTGMQYAKMDEIVRGLIEKNYAQLNAKLNLYRFWIVLLHVKGVRFVAAKD